MPLTVNFVDEVNGEVMVAVFGSFEILHMLHPGDDVILHDERWRVTKRITEIDADSSELRVFVVRA